jgi:arylsulfatase A-like enzyme
MYEQSFRTPMIIRYPGEIKAGSVNDKMVMNLDFAPTFLDYAGIAKPADMQGESFRQLVSGKSGEWRDAVYYHYYEYPAEHMVKRHYGISTERYKLMHFYYDIDEWELYDLKADPQEMTNVYAKPEYASIQADLHKRLEDLRKKYGDSDELNQQYLKSFLESRKK